MAYSKQGTVTAFGALIKKATMPETVEEAKNQHRNTLHEFIDTYKKEVSEGKLPGIRNAKDLIEVMKLDLLLMGEATERTDTSADTVHLTRLETVLDNGSEEMQTLLNGILAGINGANDDLDKKPAKEPYLVGEYVEYTPDVEEVEEDKEPDQE